MKYLELEKKRDKCKHSYTKVGNFGYYGGKGHAHSGGAVSCDVCGYCHYCENWVGKGNYK